VSGSFYDPWQIKVENEVKIETKTELEKFSNSTDLTETLQAIEQRHIQAKPAAVKALQSARDAVVSALESAYSSRYCLGEALEQYRIHYKSEHAWMEAAEAIASAMRCGSRTIRNVISDYEALKPLPEKVIEASHSLRIDLARKKYAPAVRKIHTSLASVTHLDDRSAKEIVEEAVHGSSHKASTDELFVDLTTAEKTLWKIRLKIRTAVNNIEKPRKLSSLVAAIEEEMFVVWGETDPVTVTITPRPSTLTIDGRKRRG
jgi:hypothetical protein